MEAVRFKGIGPLKLVGIPFDGTQTFRKGARHAPGLLRSALGTVETMVGDLETSDHLFFSDLGDCGPEEIREKISPGDAAVIFGGDHSVTYGSFLASGLKTLVCFDAHPDCEPGSGHDSVSRMVAESGARVFVCGVRTASAEEKRYLETGRVRIVTPEELGRVPGPVYLSVDFDVLDPSVLPAVGNPEPEGFGFAETVRAISSLAGKVRVVDFVEFTPLGVRSLDEIYAHLAARFVLEVLTELFLRRPRAD